MSRSILYLSSRSTLLDIIECGTASRIGWISTSTTLLLYTNGIRRAMFVSVHSRLCPCMVGVFCAVQGLWFQNRPRTAQNTLRNIMAQTVYSAVVNSMKPCIVSTQCTGGASCYSNNKWRYLPTQHWSGDLCNGDKMCSQWAWNV